MGRELRPSATRVLQMPILLDFRGGDTVVYEIVFTVDGTEVAAINVSHKTEAPQVPSNDGGHCGGRLDADPTEGHERDSAEDRAADDKDEVGEGDLMLEMRALEGEGGAKGEEDEGTQPKTNAFSPDKGRPEVGPDKALDKVTPI